MALRTTVEKKMQTKENLLDMCLGLKCRARAA